MKREFLYNHPVSGEQKLVEAVSVADWIPLLWDSKPKSKGGNGPFPDEMRDKVGGLSLVDGELVFDQNVKDTHDAAMADRKKPATDKNDALDRLKALDLSKTVPQSALKDVILVLTK